MAFLSSISNALLLAFGFGFVIFFHELGHFLAAKWADVKVEQFAVGFGQAMFSWRKGLGYRWGSTQQDFHQRLIQHIEENYAKEVPVKERIGGYSDAQLSQAASELGISETEYRLNWIPLGGYVKMLGQDDLKPGATVNDPRAYNNKTIGQRMVIVSAGVIMNVILAAIGFMTIFLVGFRVPPAQVGAVVPGSPAQQAYKVINGKQVAVGLQPGDLILYLNDKYQSDFEKIQLNTALMEGGPIPIYVEHRDKSTDHLTIVPAKADGGDFLLMGIFPPVELQGVDPKTYEPNADRLLADYELIKPGEVITQIAGENVDPRQFWKLHDALRAAHGKAVPITVTTVDGKLEPRSVTPHFMDRFPNKPVQFAGLLMRPQIDQVRADSPAIDKLLPGDVIVAFADASQGGDRALQPTVDEFRKWLDETGRKGTKLNVTVLRDGQIKVLNDIDPHLKLNPNKFGLDIALGSDEMHPVVAGTVEGSPARDKGVPPGVTINSVNGQPIASWFDVYEIMSKLTPEQTVTLSVTEDGQSKDYALGKLTEDQLTEIRQNDFYSDLALRPATFLRKTSNPLVAAAWGVGETRDSILQVYQTVRAMLSHNISPKQVSGPVGIFAAGYKFAERGITRLIWFLSIISANLAVMNFLPIPIVDGGLFTFLIIEKIKGGPISPRVQAIAQVVGLAILLSVFVFATYQDVFNRLPFLSR